MRHCCMTRGAGGGLGTVGACFFTVLMSTNCGCCRGGSRIGRTTVPSGGFPPVDAHGLRGLKEQSTCKSKRTNAEVATRAPNLISLEQASLRSISAYLAGVATVLPPLRSKFTGTFDFSTTFGLGLPSGLCLGRVTSPPLACDNGGRPLPRLGSGSDVEVIERLSLLGAWLKSINFEK